MNAEMNVEMKSTMEQGDNVATDLIPEQIPSRPQFSGKAVIVRNKVAEFEESIRKMKR